MKGTEGFLNKIGGEYQNFSWGVKFDTEFSSKTDDQFKPYSNQQHYVTPFPINFTGLSIPTVNYTHPDYAPLRVLAAVLSSKFLHPEIREKKSPFNNAEIDACIDKMADENKVMRSD